MYRINTEIVDYRYFLSPLPVDYQGRACANLNSVLPQIDPIPIVFAVYIPWRQGLDAK